MTLDDRDRAGWNLARLWRGSERFRDRVHAGRALAPALEHLRGRDVLVLGIPRGGVPVAAEVASALDAELDILVAKKVGAPDQPELALGAVTADGHQFIDRELVHALGVNDVWLRREITHKALEARERANLLRSGRAAPRIEGRTVILVDDGLATGATARVCARALRDARPKRLVLAVPVGSQEACDALEAEVDELVCLSRPKPFFSVGEHFDDFDPTSEERVRELLDAASARHAPPAP